MQRDSVSQWLKTDEELWFRSRLNDSFDLNDTICSRLVFQNFFGEARLTINVYSPHNKRPGLLIRGLII